MRRFIPIIILSLLFGGVVFAQEGELPDAGLTPDSPFYFLERATEAVRTFFTFGDLKKAERHALLAAERLAEAQAVVEKGSFDQAQDKKTKLIEKTLARYEIQLQNSMARAEKAQNKGQNTEQVMARVGQATSKHLEVLAEVYEKVPEEDKGIIENAMKASVKGHEKAVKALRAQNALGDVPEEVSLPARVPQEARERIQERVRQESEAEKILEGFESLGTVRAFCIEQGGPPEACERFPLEGYKSFEPLEAFCIEMGGPSDACASIEAMCEEYGAATPDECFILFFTATTRTVSTPEVKMEESRIREETQEESRTQGEVEGERMEEREKTEKKTERIIIPSPPPLPE